MRNISISIGEYYHVLNRGNHKQEIFKDKKDWARFLFLILHLQSPTQFPQIGRIISSYVKNSVFDIDKAIKDKIISAGYVDLIGFALMPNHFHLLLHEKEERGIERYMHRVLISYTKYFNTKYQTSGHLFQGPYKAVHIEDNDQLLYLSTYIHRNPRELNGWKNKEHEYVWSSYQDYILEDRWAGLLRKNIIEDQFKNKNEYKEFVETSSAKEFLEEFDDDK